ncbi:hypothetical protein RI367_001999 [Sorochytrium milnesiophthora]
MPKRRRLPSPPDPATPLRRGPVRQARLTAFFTGKLNIWDPPVEEDDSSVLLPAYGTQRRRKASVSKAAAEVEAAPASPAAAATAPAAESSATKQLQPQQQSSRAPSKSPVAIEVAVPVLPSKRKDTHPPTPSASSASSIPSHDDSDLSPRSSASDSSPAPLKFGFFSRQAADVDQTTGAATRTLQCLLDARKEMLKDRQENDDSSSSSDERADEEGHDFIVANQHNPFIWSPAQALLLKSSMDEVCPGHERERIIHTAKEKGWPMPDEVTKLLATVTPRIHALKPSLDKIISGESTSYYCQKLVEIIKEKGAKYRSVKNFEARHESLRPGYYGHRGAELIKEALAKMYIYSGNPLSEESTGVLSVTEFLHEVLMPEAAVLLIRQDMQQRPASSNATMDQARHLKDDSAEYGSVFFAL